MPEPPLADDGKATAAGKSKKADPGIEAVLEVAADDAFGYVNTRLFETCRDGSLEDVDAVLVVEQVDPAFNINYAWNDAASTALHAAARAVGGGGVYGAAV